jgi:hypothetical protein
LPKDKLNFALHELCFITNDSEGDSIRNEFDSDSTDGYIMDEFVEILTRPRPLAQWAKSLHVDDLIADAIPLKLGDPLRTVSELAMEEVSIICRNIALGLEKLILRSSADLKQAFAAAEELKLKQSKGDSKFNIVALSCGKIEDFHIGIEGRIGMLFDFKLGKPIVSV